jgi:hypothetical protein
MQRRSPRLTFLTRTAIRREFRGIAARILDRAVATGELPSYYFDKSPLIRRDDFERWLAEHRRAARAVKAKNAGRHVSASCAGTIAGLTGQLVQEIASP